MEGEVDEDPRRFTLKGKNAEEIAYDLATRSFFVDWCFLNPKLPDGKELCDLLVVFDDTAMIWQIKDLKLDENGRYSTQEVEKNRRQLSGARRKLLDSNIDVTIHNPRRQPEKLDPNSIKRVLLFSLLMGEGEETYTTIETFKSLTLHVVTKDFLEIVLKELDTITDFLDYYVSKEEALNNPSCANVVISGGEEELLGWYIQQGRSFAAFENVTQIFLEDGIWSGLTTDTEYIAKQREDSISYGWDSIIERAHTAGTETYERVARELARPNRFKRRSLSIMLYEAMHTANADTIHDLHRRVVPDFDGVTYCFLLAASNRDREHRRAALKQFCFVARGVYKDSPMVIGIATEKGFPDSTSYDFFLIDMPKWGPDQESAFLELQEKTGILTNIQTGHHSADEFPKL